MATWWTGKIIQGLQAQYKRDVSRLEDKLKFGKFPSTQQSLPESDGGPGNNRNQKEYIKQEPHFEKWQPIGQIKSWFRHKNGTPKGRDFLHLQQKWWETKDGNHVKSKVAPPRLKGKTDWCFPTRSPHRPNP
ncbi:uncharacterized protein LOC119573507 [Penaeus monodon]|uniref:uncharacterized protein LOC119573507 n=1 Tax=Penaeus monodon TaxID=6687 RepID=UPI0018A6E92F|nr:uncharacterized protein LOC119573507 [Penaeus monodon]